MYLERCIAPPIHNIPKLKGNPAKFPDKVQKANNYNNYIQNSEKKALFSFSNVFQYEIIYVIEKLGMDLLDKARGCCVLPEPVLAAV